MSDSLEAQYEVGHGVGFWIQVIRALLLLTLGLSLLFVPDKTHKMLFNAMGLFWLTTSLVLIRREAHQGGNRLWLVVAIMTIAGLIALAFALPQLTPEICLWGFMLLVMLWVLRKFFD